MGISRIIARRDEIGEKLMWAIAQRGQFGPFSRTNPPSGVRISIGVLETDGKQIPLELWTVKPWVTICPQQGDLRIVQVEGSTTAREPREGEDSFLEFRLGRMLQEDALRESTERLIRFLASVHTVSGEEKQSSGYGWGV